MKHNRVLVFSTDDHLYPAGGAEQAFGNITERLPHIEFYLICARLRMSAPRYEQVKNVHIHRIGFGIPRVDGYLLALVGHWYAYRLMQKHPFDLVWSIMASYGAFSAVRLKRKTGIPFLLTLQEGDSFEYIYKRVRYVRHAFNNIFKNADGLQAISHHLLRWGREMGFQGDVAEVVPNGVAIDAFTENIPIDVITKKRSSFGFPDGSTILVTSSRLERKNGIEDVVKALTLLPERFCFVVCGSGSLEYSIRTFVEKNALNKRVHFLGFVNPKELPLIMQSSDIFIRPSLTEGLGNAFLEAMAARVLTIGTRAGGIPDFLTDGVTGFMVAIQNPKSISDVVMHIDSMNEEEKIKIRDTAEHLVSQMYNWDSISKKMAEIFDILSS